MEVVVGPSPEADKQFIDMIVHFLVSNFDGSDKSRLNWKANLLLLFAVWNGGFSLVGKIRHYCTGTDCCPNGLQSTIARLALAIQRTNVATGPPRPELGKWTKLGLSTSLFGLALTCNIFIDILELALNTVQGQAPDNPGLDADETFLLEVS